MVERFNRTFKTRMWRYLSSDKDRQVVRVWVSFELQKPNKKKKKRLKKDTELCALTRCGISLTNRHIGYPGHVKTPDVAMVQLCHGDIKAARTKDVTIFIGAITTAHARWISWIGVCCIVMLTVLSLCSWGSGYLP